MALTQTPLVLFFKHPPKGHLLSRGIGWRKEIHLWLHQCREGLQGGKGGRGTLADDQPARLCSLLTLLPTHTPARARQRASSSSPGRGKEKEEKRKKLQSSLPNLQMSDVSVNIHGGSHTVLRNVFVVARTRLAVHRIDARNWDPLVTPGDVSVAGGRRGEK